MTHSHQATARFTIASWDEHVLVDVETGVVRDDDTYYPTRGFSRAEVSYGYTGAMVGTGTLAYLISYGPNAAPISGFERFVGSIDGREGSLVFRHEGTQHAGAVEARLTVVDGLGTGDLAAITGVAHVSIEGQSPEGYEIRFGYDM
nr:DUF3224 domain-containing protein [Rhodococcus sp. (in: high G+C Gram-positive bacteria)]